MGQVLCLIVSIPDLCPLSYLYRNMKNLLENIDTDLIALEIYNQICSAYVFPDIVSYFVFVTIVIKPCLYRRNSLQK